MTWLILLTAVATHGLGCAHTQQPEPRPEQKVYVISGTASGVGSRLESGTGGAGAEAYCNELQKQCYQVCRRRKPEITSIPKGSAQHVEFCNDKCLKEFMACVKQQEALEQQESHRQELHFPNINTALVWLDEHKAEVAIGAVVVVGGVLVAPYVATYIVAVSATGALVLTPAAL